MSKTDNTAADVIEIDTQPVVKKVKVRLNKKQLELFVKIWQRHAKDSTLDDCVAEMKTHWPAIENTDASSQASSLRKHGCKMLNFRKAKMDYSDLIALADEHAD